MLMATGMRMILYAACMYGSWVMQRMRSAVRNWPWPPSVLFTPPDSFSGDIHGQVTQMLNRSDLGAREVPYPLLQKLLQAPCALAALRRSVTASAGAAPPPL